MRLRLLVGIRFQVSFTPLVGVLFTFPSRYLCTIGHQGVFRLGGWSPHVQTGFHVSRPTRGPHIPIAYGAITRSRRTFQTVLLQNHEATGLFRVRSPLLAESLLMSFPPGTEMFQFPGFASTAYVFSGRYPLLGGLPHSDIHGSTPARGSPWLFAACHVLHRLLVPRHPPNALIALENHATPLPRGGDPSCTGTIHAPNRIPKPGNTTQTPGPDPCRRANSCSALHTSLNAFAAIVGAHPSNTR